MSEPTGWDTSAPYDRRAAMTKINKTRVYKRKPPVVKTLTIRCWKTDHVLALLQINGPMTMEAMVPWFGRDLYVINSWLYLLRKRGQVELVERGQHRTPKGRRCGKWRLTR